MQRLSQMVLDMQARMTDMSSNLRLDFQEDASKMLVTLLNNLREPASAMGAETQTINLQDFVLDREATAMDEVMNKITRVKDELESKSNALDDLLGRVNRHDGQIHLLMEASQNQPSTVPPAPAARDKDLRGYIDEKIRALRDEMMDGMDIKLGDLKNSCDYKILSVREQCEGQEANYLSLAELMDSKESDLRTEMQNLKTNLEDSIKGHPHVSDSVLARVEHLEIRLNSSEKSTPSCCSSAREELKMERMKAIADLKESLEDKLASMEERLITLLEDSSTKSSPGDQLEPHDAQQKDINSLKDSVQTLENRFNVLDQLCSKETNMSVIENIQRDVESFNKAIDTVETGLKAQMNNLGALEGRVLNYSSSTESFHGELSDLKGRVGSLENSLSDVVQQQSQSLQSLNSTWDQVKSGGEKELKDLSELHRTQHQELRKRLDELGEEVKAGTDRCREQTGDVEKEIARMDGRIVNVEGLCNKLDPISGSLQRIKEGLNKHVTKLWTCVNQLNGTARAHARDIGGLRQTCRNLQDLISAGADDLQVLTSSNPGKTGMQM